MVQVQLMQYGPEKVAKDANIQGIKPASEDTVTLSLLMS